MGKRSVSGFLETLQHARKAEIERVRALILAADPKLTEQIKWNAPSFGYMGEDRITFRLQPGDRVELIFHRGAKVKDATGFAFEDTSGLLQMLAPDRGNMVLSNVADIEAKTKALTKLVKAWLAAA